MLDQCLDQAAYVSMSRADRDDLYKKQPFPITELGYGVQRIDASISENDNKNKNILDNTK